MRGDPQQQVLRFDAFTLDLARCSLRRGDTSLPIRPKAFDMLCYLAKHPGRLVTKEELHAKVWPNLTVGDDSLVRCVKDIRGVLGDHDHRLIETVPKRGYLFAGLVVAESSLAPMQIIERVPDPGPGRPPLLETARRRLFANRRVAAVLLVAAGIAAIAAMWPSKLSPVTSSAAHYAILGRNALTSERSAKANQEALALFGKALAIDPDLVPALLDYAQVLIIEVAGKWVPLEHWPARLDQAEASVERALAREPANGYAHQLKGVLLRMRGAPDRALVSFERSFILNPDSPYTYAEAGRARIEVGRPEEALADIETAIRLRPYEAAIHVWFCWAGMAALHANRNEEAYHWLLKAHEVRPHYPLPIPFLAVAYAELSREDEGKALMARHLARAPGFTIQSWQQDHPAHTPAVAIQRERIVATLKRLGVPEGGGQIGASTKRP